MEDQDPSEYETPCPGPEDMEDLVQIGPEHALESDLPSAAEEEEELWKTDLREEIEAWLEDLSGIPGLDEDEQAPETPDLYSFYAQWAAANTEARKGNRRTAEAFSHWGETLTHFEKDMMLLREQWQRLSATLPKPGLSREHCLILVDLLDRARRVAGAFAVVPESRWWQGHAKWRKAWETQRRGFAILIDHFAALLEKEGLKQIEAVGLPFDPQAMTAITVEPDSSRPDQTVIEELAPGYRLRGELLRPAQVKVSRKQPL